MRHRYPPSPIPGRRSRRPDVGQAIGLLLVAVILIASVAFAMVTIARRMTDRGAAQSAADAAALAGVVGGPRSAAVAAERNGARLISFQSVTGTAGVTVRVVVRIAGESAMARASDAP